MCPFVLVFWRIVPKYLVVASHLFLCHPLYENCGWRYVEEAKDTMKKRGDAKVVDTDDVGYAELKALGAGETLMLWGNLCNAHVEAFV